MSSHIEAPQGRVLSNIYADCFTLILQLRASAEFDDAQSLRRRIKDMLDRARERARPSSASGACVEQAHFAVVAFFDETTQQTRKGGEQWLADPLQLDYYDRYDAGEEFFVRLKKLRERPATYAEALEVFYLCLALGFRGRYQIHGEEKVQQLIEQVYEDLCQSSAIGDSNLAPHAFPEGPSSVAVKRSLPTWAIAAIAVVMALLVYSGMSLYLSNAADRTAETIQQPVSTGQTP